MGDIPSIVDVYLFGIGAVKATRAFVHNANTNMNCAAKELQQKQCQQHEMGMNYDFFCTRV